MALTRAEVKALYEDLGKLIDGLEDAAAKMPSRRITIIPGKDGYSESFSSLTEIFCKKATFYRSQLHKLAESLPAMKRGPKPKTNESP